MPCSNSAIKDYIGVLYLNCALQYIFWKYHRKCYALFVFNFTVDVSDQLICLKLILHELYE